MEPMFKIEKTLEEKLGEKYEVTKARHKVFDQCRASMDVYSMPAEEDESLFEVSSQNWGWHGERT